MHLDPSRAHVAIPSIQKDLGFSEGSIQWVYNSYLITYGGLLMLGGRVADVFGRRRLFMIGATLLACASLAAGLTSSQGLLIGARAVMGVGAAIITPAALAIIFGLFPEGEERNKALGIWGALIGLGAAVVVLAGSVITDQLGWQWTFFINVPLRAAALIASPLLLPESRVPDRPTTASRHGTPRSAQNELSGCQSCLKTAKTRCLSTASCSCQASKICHSRFRARCARRSSQRVRV